MKVLGMGNALVDVLIELPNDGLLKKFDLRKGSMQLVDKKFANEVLVNTCGLKHSEASGGSAANTICGLASLGIETTFIGKVGWDRLGEVFINDIEHYGVKSLLQYSKLETGSVLALISPDGERTFATFLGASIDMEPSELTAKMFQGYTHFYVEGYLVQHHGLIQRSVELAKEHGLEIILDMASFNVVEENLDFIHFLVKEYADIVFANAAEARVYSGKTDIQEALNEISKDCWITVVKNGASGSLIQNGKQVFHVEAKPVKVIDTTGAGDLYAAGFTYGLLNNFKLPECGKLGSYLAGKVIEVIGPKIPDKTWREIKKHMKII